MNRFLACALLVCVALFAHPAAARVPAQLALDPQCEGCLLSMHILDDVLCDPFVDDQAAQWLVDNVCSMMGSNKDACIEMVASLLPVAVEWLRANIVPEQLCSDVCPAKTLAALATAPKRVHAPENDVTCQLCMFVLERAKDALSNPITQDQIHDATTTACGELPAGGMRDACLEWALNAETTIFKYINTVEPEGVCALAGTCLAAAVARVPMQPLDPRAVAAMQQLAALVAAPPSNDNCDVCKIVIQEVRQVVANPDLQAQMVEYAKQACTLISSLTSQCQSDVDQYAPMVFGMVLAYLQPEAVCEQIKLCPPPSAQQLVSVQTARAATMAAAKFRLAGAKAQVAAS